MGEKKKKERKKKQTAVRGSILFSFDTGRDSSSSLTVRTRVLFDFFFWDEVLGFELVDMRFGGELK